MDPATTDSPDKRGTYRRDIQGLRGLAVVLVVAYHANLPFPGGFIGVDVFFVVSGFVITSMLMREFSSTGRISLRRFYGRRVRRLLPALSLMIAVVASLSIVLLGPLGQQQLAYKTGIAASGFVGNIYLGSSSSGYFDPVAESNPFLHTWSLSVEEQFYLVLPVGLWAIWRFAARGRGERPGAWPAVLAVTGVAALSAVVALSPGILFGNDPTAAASAAFYSSITRGWEFGAGVLLALMAGRLQGVSTAVGQLLLVGGGVLVLIGAVAITDTTPFPGPAALLPVVGASAMIAGGFADQRSRAGRLLSSTPLVWIGDLSYSWYLWHWPFIVFAKTTWPSSAYAAPIAALVSLGPAVGAFRLVEQPIRLGERLPKVSAVGIATSSIVFSLAFLAVLDLSGGAIRDLAPVAEYDEDTRFHLDVAEDCYRPDLRIGADCFWRSGESARSVFLVGDSNAGHLSEALLGAARDANYNLVLAVSSGCPPMQLTTIVRGAERENCDGYAEKVLEAVARDAPDVVVVAAASSIYIENSSYQLIDPDSNLVVGDPDGKALLWSEALESFLGELESVGTRVIVVNPVPHFFAHDGRVSKETCPVLRLLMDPVGCGLDADRGELEDQRSRALEAELAATAAVPSASSVDFFGFLCPDTRCAMYSRGEWMYRDSTHLSVFGASELTDQFRVLLSGSES